MANMIAERQVTQPSRTRLGIALSFAIVALASIACSKSEPATAALVDEAQIKGGLDSQLSTELIDQPIEAFRVELMALAFESASSISIYPHIKSRCRAQQWVVDASLTLDQPHRAALFIEQIENWRKGMSHADLALYCAEHGLREDAERQLELASKVAMESADDEDSQAWRVDRIKAKIAGTYISLGDRKAASRFSEGILESEAMALDQVDLSLLNPKEFDERLESARSKLLIGDLDQVRNAHNACTRLLASFYTDQVARKKVFNVIDEINWKALPLSTRLAWTLDLVSIVLEKGDFLKAHELLLDVEGLMNRAKWTLKYEVTLIARVAMLWAQSGDATRCEKLADRANDLFDHRRDQIVDIYRTEALLPLAEVYHEIGKFATATTLYKKAINEGVENPNTRPRAEALCRTCLSLALRGFEPDLSLRTRLGQVLDLVRPRD